MGLLSTFTLLATATTALFGQLQPLEIRLVGPIDAVIDHKNTREEFPFTLEHGGKPVPIDVRARGNSRLRVCGFPPLRLNFDNPAGTVFAGQDKVKLVTHCRDNDSAEKDLIEEYAVYRMYNLLTDNSLRVRLARISYVEGDKSYGTRYAFMLEPEDQLAARLKAKTSSLTAVSLKWLDHDQVALVYVFAYLVGNTDWSLVMADADTTCCHNGILLDASDGKKLYVPYDFDLTGFVNAKYAKPDPSMRISSVTQRRYRGYCTSETALRDALAHIQSKESDLMQLIDELPLLTDKNKASRKRFLAGFFKSARDPQRLLAEFARRCL